MRFGSHSLLTWLFRASLGLLIAFGYRLATKKHSPPLTKFTVKQQIDSRILQAENEFQNMLASQTHSCEAGVAAYKIRRGRNPPPGFVAWYKLAEKYDAILIEKFWDPIYDDLGPFWGFAPDVLRAVTKSVTALSPKNDVDSFWIRDGKSGTECFTDKTCASFTELLERAVLGLQEEGGVLPDMDIPFNAFISPRIWAPWDSIEESRRETARGGLKKRIDVSWDEGHDTFAMVHDACPPNSLMREKGPPSRQQEPAVDVQVKASGETEDNLVISDFHLSKSPCHQPDLLNLHGTFVAPEYQLTTRDLFPLFSVQKVVDVNHEIRIPSLLAWSSQPEFLASDLYSNWSEKTDKIFWRGRNTGGRVTRENWKSFHRHRLVTMTNATEIRKVVDSKECHISWAISSRMCEALRDESDGYANRLLALMQEKVDVGFDCWQCEEVDLPATLCGYDGPSGCDYLDEVYTRQNFVPLELGQRNKYLIDVDGNGYSARFDSLMKSNSVPIKAAIYEEWHESRFIPWKHFIPMDNRFQDLWPIAEYFLGHCLNESEKCVPHDEEAMKIGTEGGKWAMEVLRSQDMILYMSRLLLEYGRIISDDRESMKETEECS